MSWSYVDAWRAAANDLGVRIEGPCTVELAKGLTIDAEMWVHDFGNTNGALVVPDFDLFRGRSEAMRRAGFFGSAFGPYREGQEAGRENLIDCLADWGWFGQGEPPTWCAKARANVEESWQQYGLIEGQR